MRKDLKIAFSFFGLCVVVLLVLFIWKERFDLDKIINDQKISNFFSIFGSLATSTSIILLYRQIKEMQEDRKALNKPDILPEGIVFKAKDIFIGGKVYSVEATQKVKWNTVGGVKDELTTFIRVDIYNIGLGFAKEIEFKWLYSIEKVFEVIDKIFEYNSEDKEFWRKHDEVSQAREQRLAFLKPEGKDYIYFPFIYLNCCSPSLNSSNPFYKQTLSHQQTTKPPLQLIIKYRDIYGHLINKEFEAIIQTYENDVHVRFVEKNNF